MKQFIKNLRKAEVLQKNEGIKMLQQPFKKISQTILCLNMLYNANISQKAKTAADILTALLRADINVGLQLTIVFHN